jgi:hypothetical protein
MSRNILCLFILLAAVISCDDEKDDFVWEYKPGSGRAYFIESRPDSGFVNGGTLNGKAYFMQNSRTGKKVFSFTSQFNGSFRSVLSDTSLNILAGVAGSNLLLTRLDETGSLIWEKSVETGSMVGNAFLTRGEDDNFMVLCSPDADSVSLGSSQISIISFDSSGVILSQVDRTYTGFFAVTGAVSESGESMFYRLQSQPRAIRLTVRSLGLATRFSTSGRERCRQILPIAQPLWRFAVALREDFL